MNAAIERRTLDRLIALGKATGHISSEELRAHLPAATMSAEDIALVVLELEEAGVEVEFEEALLAAGRPHAVKPAAELPPLPQTAPATPVPASGVDPDAVGPARTDPGATAGPGSEEPGAGAGAHRAVLGAGALALAVIAAVLLLLGR